jgi:hypothetical protein
MPSSIPKFVRLVAVTAVLAALLTVMAAGPASATGYTQTISKTKIGEWYGTDTVYTLFRVDQPGMIKHCHKYVYNTTWQKFRIVTGYYDSAGNLLKTATTESTTKTHTSVASMTYDVRC